MSVRPGKDQIYGLRFGIPNTAMYNAAIYAESSSSLASRDA